MFEFSYYKGHGWCPGVKFSIKHHNNGWHRFFEIIVPIKNPSEKMCNFTHYQLTYWNNYTNFWGTLQKYIAEAKQFFDTERDKAAEQEEKNKIVRKQVKKRKTADKKNKKANRKNRAK